MYLGVCFFYVFQSITSKPRNDVQLYLYLQVRESLGLCPQQNMLFDDLTVRLEEERMSVLVCEGAAISCFWSL